jgi:single-stranded DNA-binding protein
MRVFWRVGSHCESKVSKNNKPYVRLALRVGDGEASQWVNCMVFDPEVIAAADKLTKGTKLYIEGNLKLDRWQAKDGSGEKTGLSIMANYVRIPAIGANKPKRDGDAAPAPAARAARYDESLDDDLPF